MNNKLRNNLSMACLASLMAMGLAGCEQGANAGAPELAEVVSVEPIKETVQNPRQDCDEVQVRHRGEPRDSHEIAGTALGAVVGGVLGNQIGDGSGQKAATVAGALAGGYAGKRIQEAHQKPVVTTTTEQRCRTVTDSSTRIVGYDVAYRYDGNVHHARMQDKPGATIEVRQGIVAVQ